jgi:hypothetical protein
VRLAGYHTNSRSAIRDHADAPVLRRPADFALLETRILQQVATDVRPGNDGSRVQAGCCHQERSPQEAEFVTRYLRMLLQGKVGYVLSVWETCAV